VNGIREALDDIAAEARRYDVTEAAVRAGRRRQRVARLAPAGAMAAVVLAAVGIWLPVHHGTQAVSTGAPTGLGADVIVGRTLYAADGRRIPLPTNDPVSWAYQVPGGTWLVSTGRTSATVWRIGTDGHSRPVLSGVRTPQYDPDSRHLVWYTPRDKRVFDGRLSGDRVVDRLSIREPNLDSGDGGLVPAAFSGADWVVLARAPMVVDAKHPTGKYAVWYPGRGTIRDVASDLSADPHADSDPVPMVTIVRGVKVLGLGAAPIMGDRRCLTLAIFPYNYPYSAVDPRRHAVCTTRDGGLTATGGITSPKGLTLIDAGTSGKIDVWKFGRGGMGIPGWAIDADDAHGAVWRLGKGYVRSVGWLDDDTVLVAYRSTATGTDRLYRIGVRPSGTADRLPLPAGASGDVTVVAPVTG
jgi:hypothetical protein